jgi:ribose transport system ATP-binding protein
MPPLLETRSISKSFGITRALDNVDFTVTGGETHILFGENGAGKSTLVKILSGAYRADSGSIVMEGTPVEIHSPTDARQHGIATVFQDFSLVPTICALDNLFLGKERTSWGFLNRGSMRGRAKAIFERLHLSVDLGARVSELGRADQQMVEIAKALLNNVRVLILDEPTSSLTEDEAERLFVVLEDLKRAGCGVVLISHRLDEVLRQGDRITVLRDGAVVSTVRRGEVDEDALIQMITGTSRTALFPPQSSPGTELALSFDNVSSGGLKDVSFALHRGEILGIAGLAGSGTTQVARALFGLDRHTAGTIRIDGIAVKRPEPREMLRRGVIFFPSDRLAEGLLPVRSVKENLTIEALATRFVTGGFVDRGQETETARAIAAQLMVKMSSIDAAITDLSGGNQQKIMLARGLLRDFKVLILDDPTIGVDMQTKAEIYRLLSKLAQQGVAILIVSSDLDELIGLANRILVMCEGRMAAAPQPTLGRHKRDFLSLFFPGGATGPQHPQTISNQSPH